MQARTRKEGNKGEGGQQRRQHYTKGRKTTAETSITTIENKRTKRNQAEPKSKRKKTIAEGNVRKGRWWETYRSRKGKLIESDERKGGRCGAAVEGGWTTGGGSLMHAGVHRGVGGDAETDRDDDGPWQMPRVGEQWRSAAATETKDSGQGRG